MMKLQIIFLLLIFATSSFACEVVEMLEVRGTSMVPLLKDGQRVEYLQNFYQCHSVKRGDLVTFKYRKGMAVKRVVGIPGDKITVGGGNIFINGKLLKNSQGKAYTPPLRMIRIYIKDYPTLPADTYFIMGEKVTGSLDSSKIGFVSSLDFLGKIILP